MFEPDDIAERLDGPMHDWFGLTYASYLVLHRSVIQVMPVEWQRKLVALLEEVEATIDTSDFPGDRFRVNVIDSSGRFVRDLYRQYRHGPRPRFKKPEGVIAIEKD